MRLIIPILLFLIISIQSMADELGSVECLGVEPSWSLTKKGKKIQLSIDVAESKFEYDVKNILQTTNSTIATVVRTTLRARPPSSADESTPPSEFELLLKPTLGCRLESDLEFSYEAFLISKDFILHGCCYDK
jgi:hypothetical protein